MFLFVSSTFVQMRNIGFVIRWFLLHFLLLLYIPQSKNLTDFSYSSLQIRFPEKMYVFFKIWINKTKSLDFKLFLNNNKKQVGKVIFFSLRCNEYVLIWKKDNTKNRPNRQGFLMIFNFKLFQNLTHKKSTFFFLMQ